MKKYFYEINVLTLTVVAPIASTIIELSVNDTWNLEAFFLILAKWIVFWGIGIRLLIAGMSQIFKPEFTLSILSIKSGTANQIVRELGFANLSIGVAGVLSLILPAFTFWTPAVALIGGLFLGLAGVEHLRKKNRNFKENIALFTDLFVAIIALTFSIGLIAVQLSIPHFG